MRIVLDQERLETTVLLRVNGFGSGRLLIATANLHHPSFPPTATLVEALT